MLYFLVYNDNTHTIHIQKLLQSVKIYGKEFQIIVFNKNDIDDKFKNNNSSILNCKRGGGYWLWKPYIINETLKKIKNDDIVFYMDSKYYFIENFTKLYSDYIINNDILLWKNKPNESIYYMKNWCKMDVIHKYNIFDKVFNENVEDCWAGAIMVKKNKNTIQYIQEWLDMCCIYEDITDSHSKRKNSDTFNEHRHDQSLLSIIVDKYNIKLQYFEKKYLQNVRSPFLTNISEKHNNPVPKIIKKPTSMFKLQLY
jgi:hypothetical protein